MPLKIKPKRKPARHRAADRVRREMSLIFPGAWPWKTSESVEEGEIWMRYWRRSVCGRWELVLVADDDEKVTAALVDRDSDNPVVGSESVEWPLKNSPLIQRFLDAG